MLFSIDLESMLPTSAARLAGTEDLYTIRVRPATRLLASLREDRLVVIDIVNRASERYEKLLADVSAKVAAELSAQQISRLAEVGASDRSEEETSAAIETIAPGFLSQLRKLVVPDDAKSFYGMLAFIVGLAALGNVLASDSDTSEGDITVHNTYISEIHVHVGAASDTLASREAGQDSTEVRNH